MGYPSQKRPHPSGPRRGKMAAPCRCRVAVGRAWVPEARVRRGRAPGDRRPGAPSAPRRRDGLGRQARGRAAADTELALGAVRAVRRELRLVVLSGHVDLEEPPAARRVVGENKAFRAPEMHAADDTPLSLGDLLDVGLAPNGVRDWCLDLCVERAQDGDAAVGEDDRHRGRGGNVGRCCRSCGSSTGAWGHPLLPRRSHVLDAG
jgi:hypothetical protein